MVRNYIRKKSRGKYEKIIFKLLSLQLKEDCRFYKLPKNMAFLAKRYVDMQIRT